MNYELTLTQFTPAEAERITGVTTMAQRDWRRRGILRKRGEGQARFHLFDLSLMFAIKLLSDRGVPLDDASDVADWCGMGIGFRALQWIDAYEGDHQRTNEARGLPEKQIGEKEAELVRRAAGAADVDISGFEKNFMWVEKGDWLARQVYRKMFTTGVVPGELFIWWANGDHTFHESFDAARDGMTSADPRLAGPALILDLRSLASVLIDRAGRAFVHVEFPDLPALPVEPPTSDDAGNLSAGASAPAKQKDLQ